MRSGISNPSVKSMEQFLNFIMGDDLDFYEECIVNLSDEEQQEFFRRNPDFMSEYFEKCDRIELLKDKRYRSILRKIKEYEEE